MRSLLSRFDRFLAPPPDPEGVGWLGQWTYAHRGLHSPGIPENSLAAFAGAVAAGLGVECDVQRSRDGHAMLVHDWELERLTGIKGRLADYSSDELAQIAFLEPGHFIARFDDLLGVVEGKVPILIEIKSKRWYRIEASCRAIRDAVAGYGGPHAVMSFDPRVSRWFRRNSPRTLRGLVMREDEKGHTRKAWQRHFALWHARPDFVAYHVEALPSRFAASLRGYGIPVLTWTVNTPEQLALARAHADAPIAEGAGLEA